MNLLAALFLALFLFPFPAHADQAAADPCAIYKPHPNSYVMCQARQQGIAAMNDAAAQRDQAYQAPPAAAVPPPAVASPVSPTARPSAAFAPIGQPATPMAQTAASSSQAAPAPGFTSVTQPVHAPDNLRVVDLRVPPAIRIPDPLPDISSPPVQKNLAVGGRFKIGDYTLTAVASYAMTARVLLGNAHRTDLTKDKLAQLSDYDIVLGWNHMADPLNLIKLHMWQSERTVHLQQMAPLPLTADEIATSLSHNHLIPADPEVEADIQRLDNGQTVTLIGFLVNVLDPDHGYWRTSVVRNDTGAGACEIFYVVHIIRHPN